MATTFIFLQWAYKTRFGLVLNAIRDNEDKITDDEKTDVEEKIASLKGLLEDEGASLDDLKEAVESLNTASQGFAQRLYEAAAQQESTDEADDMDDIIDAEIIDEEEET